MEEEFKCIYCGKLCKNKNSKAQHECRCKNNPNRRAFNVLAEYSSTHFKGQTKYTNESINKSAMTLAEGYKNGSIIHPFKGKPGTFLGKHHTKEWKENVSKKVSKARVEGYKNGSITPARGVGRGKYSYIVYEDKKYMLRSTYEFIYALYLLTEGIKFNMEDVRVSAIEDNKYAKTFICDFNLYEINTIVEIKGIASDKDKYIRESFESAGYIFIEYFKNDIDKFKNNLINKGYDMDSILQSIYKGHELREYFVYEFKC